MYKVEQELSYGCFSNEPMKDWLKEMRGKCVGGEEETGGMGIKHRRMFFGWQTQVTS